MRKLVLALIMFGLFISLASATETIVNRTATTDTYKINNTNVYTSDIYSAQVNMVNDSSGKYEPYTSVTNFSKIGNDLILKWNNKSVTLSPYIVEIYNPPQLCNIITHRCTNNPIQNIAVPLSDMNSTEKSDLQLNTGIVKRDYNYDFNITMSQNDTPQLFGYNIATENVTCTTSDDGLKLVCDEQTIDFSDAQNIQNLSVNVADDNIEIIATDTTNLSYIDPTVDLTPINGGGDSPMSTYYTLSGGDDIYYEYWWRGARSNYMPVGWQMRYSGATDHFSNGCSVSDDGCWELSRLFYTYDISGITSGSTINSVTFQAHTGDYASSHDYIDVKQMYQSDVSDWTPSDATAYADMAIAIYDAPSYASNVHMGFTDTTVAIGLGANAISTLSSERSANHNFHLGVKNHADANQQGNIDEYSDAYVELVETSKITVVYTLPDTTPPTTTATGHYAYNGSTYTFGTISYSQPINVTLSCSDAGVGCQHTYYCNDTINTCTPTTLYSAPFQISKEHLNYVRYYSTDNNNNAEGTKNVNLTIIYDTISPVVTINSISTMDSSQVVYFNASVVETNLSYCAFSLFDLSNSIAGYNQTHFTPDALTQFSTPAFANYHLNISCYDLSGNIGTASVDFGTSEGSSSGGGITIGGGGGNNNLPNNLITNQSIAPNLENNLFNYLSTGAFKIGGTIITWFTLILIIAVILVIIAEVNHKKPLKVLK